MKPDLRTQILEASAVLLEEGGIGALSLREVARRAGVSHQAPYHYFADREAILAELVGNGFETLHAYEQKGLVDVRGANERVAAMGKAYATFALDNPAIFKLMFRKDLVDMHKFPEANCAADKAFEVPHQVVAEATGKALDDCLPEMLACWSMAHGLATLLLEGKMEHHIGPSREAQNACVDAVVNAYVRRAYS